MKSLDHAVLMDDATVSRAMTGTFPVIKMTEERLPFTVRVVRSEEALHKAVAIRQAAYARHMPALAEKLGVPEPNDHDQGSVVLLAESKFDGSPLGTMRIQTNRYNALSIEQEVALPEWLRNNSLAEATRLGIDQGRTGRVVKMVLCKAFFLYCIDADIDWMVIRARPPLDRQYEAALFSDVYPGEIIPMRQANNVPHRVLAFEIATAAERWAEARHPLHKFMIQTYHPDIDLGDSVTSMRRHPVHSAEMTARMAIGA